MDGGERQPESENITATIESLESAYPYHSCMGIHEWYDFHGLVNVGKSIYQCHGWILGYVGYSPSPRCRFKGSRHPQSKKASLLVVTFGNIQTYPKSPSMGRTVLVYFDLHEYHENQPIHVGNFFIIWDPIFSLGFPKQG